MAFNILKAAGAFALIALCATTTLAQTDPLGAAPAARTDKTTIIVGSADFPESQLLATIYAKALAAKASRRIPNSTSAAVRFTCRRFSTDRSTSCRNMPVQR